MLSNGKKTANITPSNSAVEYRTFNPSVRRSNRLWETNSNLYRGVDCLNTNYRVLQLPNHPKASVSGCVYEHIIAAEEMLGRPLGPEEVVHHIDGNKKNNKHTNLLVFKDISSHVVFHRHNCDESLLVLEPNGSYSCPGRLGYFNECPQCGKAKNRTAKLCLLCYKNNKSQSVSSKESLLDALKEADGNFTQVGRKYGVSCNNIRKWCKKYGMPFHSLDYKQKANYLFSKETYI